MRKPPSGFKEYDTYWMKLPAERAEKVRSS